MQMRDTSNLSGSPFGARLLLFDSEEQMSLDAKLAFLSALGMCTYLHTKSRDLSSVSVIQGDPHVAVG